ncbi:hypothetical protein SO802_022853 [Lithocarpus litseifolius]|uniref:DUF4283 domain-containing protein n=1 Tax=Lithocarpus litseifolius TaxID=425828 RepID=A0AAW2CA39_9ROSI
MEDLANRWKRLSLSKSEGKNVDLSRNKKNLSFALAENFFMRRSINIEAAARTFCSIWQTRGSFEVSDKGNNIALIAFELEVDVEKVLQGKLWAFDRHLVAFLRYDGLVLVQNLCFEKTTFWVQLHNLPFALLTVEVATSIRETIGVVVKPKDVGEM